MKMTDLTTCGNKTNIRWFVDMDGVIADFVSGITKLINKPYDEQKYKSDPKYRKEMWRAVSNHSKQGGTLWLDLPMMSDAKILLDYIKKYNPGILSATGHPEYGAASQKNKWIKKYIGSNIKVTLVRTSNEKANHAHPGDILIDDQSKSIDPWIAAGGVGILHKTAADTIAQLKTLGY